MCRNIINTLHNYFYQYQHCVEHEQTQSHIKVSKYHRHVKHLFFYQD